MLKDSDNYNEGERFRMFNFGWSGCVQDCPS